MTDLPPIQTAAKWLYRNKYLMCIDEHGNAENAYAQTVRSLQHKYKDIDTNEIRRQVRIARDNLIKTEKNKDADWKNLSTISANTISQELKERFRTEIEKTAEDGIEHGFIMCANNGNIIAKDSCDGNECDIKLGSRTGECDITHTRHIGDFHTHPHVTQRLPSMSYIDIKNLLTQQRNDMKQTKCVGSPFDPNKIVCFTPKRRTYKSYKHPRYWFENEIREEIIDI